MPAVVTGFRAEAVHLRDELDLPASLIARGTGANESTVRAWVAGSRRPSGVRAERLAELSATVDRLLGIMRRDYVEVWLVKPNPSLEHAKPVDVIASGGYSAVGAVISAIEGQGAA